MYGDLPSGLACNDASRRLECRFSASTRLLLLFGDDNDNVVTLHCWASANMQDGSGAVSCMVISCRYSSNGLLPPLPIIPGKTNANIQC